jgi:molecular chaperone DnaJ
LYIVLTAQPHKFFKRDGDDIILELPINVAQAALGDELEIPILEGSTTIKIPAGVQSGKVMRLKGKGISHLKGAGRGDQVVVLRVVIPQALDAQQRRLFQELAKSLGKPDLKADKGFLGRIKDALGGTPSER